MDPTPIRAVLGCAGLLVSAGFALLVGYGVLTSAGRAAWFIALTHCARHRVRSSLALGGVSVGVAAVVATLSAGDSVQAFVAREVDERGGRAVIEITHRAEWEGIAGTTLTSRIHRRKTGRAGPLLYADYLNLRMLLTTAVAVSAEHDLGYAGIGRARFEDVYRRTVVVGTTPEYAETHNWPVVHGRFISHADLADYARVVVIGARLAEALFGDLDPVGEEIRLSLDQGMWVRLKIVGVMRENGSTQPAWGRLHWDEWLFVPITTYHQRLLGSLKGWWGRGMWVGRIRIESIDLEDVPYTIAEAKRTLARRHREPDAYQFWTATDEIETAERLSTVLNLLLGTVAGLTLAVSGAAIANVMFVSVRERTGEIGLRKAVGATSRRILVQFLIEACVLGIGGAAIGCATGCALTAGVIALLEWFISDAGDLPLVLSTRGMGAASLSAIGVSLLSGCWPACRACRVNPTDALRWK